MSDEEGAEFVRITWRTPEERLDWLLQHVAVLTGRVGTLERRLNAMQTEESTMSNEVARQAENALLNTDDASVWAEEFCRIFNGRTIVNKDAGGADNEFVDVGGMIAWFANAMQTAVNQYERKKMRDAELKAARESAATRDVPETAREAFTTGVSDGREGATDLDDPTT